MDNAPTIQNPVIDTDAALARRIRELVELGQPIYIPPTKDENDLIQIIALEDVLVLDPDQFYCAGLFHLVSDE
jgi:hypothetical protein